MKTEAEHAAISRLANIMYRARKSIPLHDRVEAAEALGALGYRDADFLPGAEFLRPHAMTFWYAASDDVVRMGPYPSQVEAWEALRRRVSHSHRPVHVPGAYVWPELDASET